MTTIPLAGSKRRFTGSSAVPGGRQDGLAALADLLLTPAPPPRDPPATAPSPPVAPAAPCVSAPNAETPTIVAEAPRGLYVVVPAGIDGPERRQVAMAVAAHLAPHGGTAAIFVFENGRADAHVLGEPACGRLGSQNLLHSTETPWMLRDLLDQCDQVALLLLDGGAQVAQRLAGLAPRAIFVAAADAESVIETYRELKGWCGGGPAGEVALLVVGRWADEAAAIHRRLQIAARQFLGCDVRSQGFLPWDESAAAGLVHPEPPRILAGTPASAIWARLLSRPRRAVSPDPIEAAVPASESPCIPARAVASGDRLPADALPAPAAPDPCRVFALWQPDRAALLQAIETQMPLAAGEQLQHVFRVEVDEPDAPPLAAVRADGTLVAILLEDGEPVDARRAMRWLTVHRRLLARAYPCSGIDEGAEPAAIVLAPLAPPPAAADIRRFLPVRMGGHGGIVLLP